MTKKEEESYRKNINNINFLSRFISKKDFVYSNMIFNIWSKLNFENFSEDFFEEKKIDLLKENLNFYVKEANKIFNLYLYKVEIFKIPYQMLYLNNKNSKNFDETNDCIEFLCWKNLKILKKNEEKKDKKKVEVNNINIE